MRIFSVCFRSGLTSAILIGCATTQNSSDPVTQATAKIALASTITQDTNAAGEASNEQLPIPMDLDDKTSVKSEAARIVGLPELMDLTLDRNPRLAQVSWAVESARGRAVQAGLYPNPTASVTGLELGDRTGAAGIWSVFVGQEIVTANKLELSQAAAFKEVDQAALNLVTERYQIFTAVREAFFEAIMLQRRADILAELLKLAEQSVENANKLVRAKEAAELDVVQLEVNLERYRADLEATQRALPGSYRKLAASIGFEEMQITRLVGDLDTPLPQYDLDQIRTYVLSIHPELRSAQVGVERAKLVLQKATVEPIPNVTVGTGYTYQSQNRSHDWDVGVSIPLPLWNKNEGNIAAARSEVNEAVHQVGRVQNDLVNRLASSFAIYASAKQRSERYRSAILPRAERTFRLSQAAYQGGQFEYLRVLEAQRAVAEANLELVRSLGELWQAASQIAGLMLEDNWPLAPTALQNDGSHGGNCPDPHCRRRQKTRTRNSVPDGDGHLGGASDLDVL